MEKLIRSTSIVALVIILLFSFTSCGKSHSCTGSWNGETHYGEFLHLSVDNKGTYTLMIFKKKPTGIPQLETDNFYLYKDKWERVSDNVIELKYSSFESKWNGSSSTISSIGKFYLMNDGAFTQNNMNFSNPLCKMKKR